MPRVSFGARVTTGSVPRVSFGARVSNGGVLRFDAVVRRGMRLGAVGRVAAVVVRALRLGVMGRDDLVTLKNVRLVGAWVGLSVCVTGVDFVVLRSGKVVPVMRGGSVFVLRGGKVVALPIVARVFLRLVRIGAVKGRDDLVTMKNVRLVGA